MAGAAENFPLEDAMGMTEMFNSRFANWQIRLPEEAAAERQPGKIVARGWVIWYRFGEDERGEFLDVYSTHRMTEDQHARFYESGERESLEAIRGMRVGSSDPEEDKVLRAEHIARNRRVAAMLQEKGFGPDAGDPMSMLTNRALRTGMAGDQADR